MLHLGDRDKFHKAIIAQDDDNDYDESGYVAVKIDDWCAISRYGHCSCYDTWADITGGGISDYEGSRDPQWDWTGTWEEMLNLAERKADLTMPEREANPKDHDYDHLMNVYKQILEHK